MLLVFNGVGISILGWVYMGRPRKENPKKLYSFRLTDEEKEYVRNLGQGSFASGFTILMGRSKVYDIYGGLKVEKILDALELIKT
jgi:hypothetical protein